MQSSGFCWRLLGPVSDNVLINRVSKERALHQAIKYPSCAIWSVVHHMAQTIKMLTKNVRRRSTELLTIEVKAAFDTYLAIY